MLMIKMKYNVNMHYGFFVVVEVGVGRTSSM